MRTRSWGGKKPGRPEVQRPTSNAQHPRSDSAFAGVAWIFDPTLCEPGGCGRGTVRRFIRRLPLRARDPQLGHLSRMGIPACHPLTSSSGAQLMGK